MSFNRKFQVFFLIFCFSMLVAGFSYAQEAGKQKLQDVILHVYDTHPGLKSSKAELLSTIETISVALSDYRPTITAGASATSQITEPGSFGTPTSDQQNLNFSLSQPLYRGGRTTAAVRAADHRIEASKAIYVSEMQSTFLSVVSAYVNVLRNKEILALRVNNENVLSKELEAAQARFDLGDVTRTDVSQASSRLSAAIAERVEAQGTLQSSLAEYERVTGMQAKGLEPPIGLDDSLWEDRENLAEWAMDYHPDIVAARSYEYMAKSDAREILGQLLPEISLVGSVNRDFNPTFASEPYTDNSRITLDATIPLYLGGAARAQYRQSKYENKMRAYERKDIERQVRESIVKEWEDLMALRAQVKARQAQVTAADLAFEGVSEESRLGARTTLDVLDAEQERLNAQVNLVSAEYDVVISEYQLLAAAGMLTSEFLGIKGVGEDIRQKYSAARRNWFGFSIDEE